MPGATLRLTEAPCVERDERTIDVAVALMVLLNETGRLAAASGLELDAAHIAVDEDAELTT
jgi:hypothetical protein